MESTHDGFDQHVVIVTGAGSGIGRAAAIAFADAGARVLGVGRRAGRLEETAAGRPSIATLAVDVRDDDAAAAIVEEAIGRWGRIDVLVNNAGVFTAMPLGELDAQRITEITTTNVIAPSLLADAALPHLKRTGGAIINVSSTFGHRPAPGAGHYGATKAAVEHLTRSWALELASHGVRVNAVAPGPTESDALAAAGLSPDAIDQIKDAEADRIPLRRRGEPEEVARWIVRLALPGSAWVTGQVLAVDGGLALT